MVGLLAAAGLLLIVAGGSKLRAPEAAGAALRAARLRMPAGLARPVQVRLLGVIQAGAGAAVLVLDRRPAGLIVLVSFAALAAFSWRMAAVAPDQGCGCFGATDGPVRPRHIAMDLLLAGLGAVAALWPGPGFGPELTRQPMAGLPLIALTALLAYACYLLMSALPDLSAARSASQVAR
jgi:hypothetical protein